MPRYLALAEHWRRHPPVHIALAVWLGYGQDQPQKKTQDFESFFRDLTGQAPPM